MPVAKNPYDVLELPGNASKEDIKRAYRRLAKAHHPDRWSGKNIPPETLQSHQERFKDITVAYHCLMESNGQWAGTGTETKAEKTTTSQWDDLWHRMENVFQSTGFRDMIGLLLKRRQANATVYESAFGPHEDPKEEPEPTTSAHTFTIPVSLEDIHLGKRKKVRLMLRGDPEPLYINVMCDRYPRYETRVMRPGNIHRQLTLILQPVAHPIYTIDSMDEVALDETSGWNLFRRIPMTLLDYIQGKHVEWMHLDGTSWHEWVPPLSALSDPDATLAGILWKRLPGKGLAGRGDMYLSFYWRLPTSEDWNALSLEEQSSLILILEKLTHPNHSGAPDAPHSNENHLKT